MKERKKVSKKKERKKKIQCTVTLDRWMHTALAKNRVVSPPSLPPSLPLFQIECEEGRLRFKAQRFNGQSEKETAKICDVIKTLCR